LYLPSIGIFLFVIDALGRKLETKSRAPPFLLVCAALVAVEAGATIAQNRVWQDPVTFYRNILKYEARGTARVHNNLAMALSSTERGEAIEHYRKAIALEDRYPQVHHNLGLLLLEEGQTDAAIAELKRGLEINPSFFYSYGALSQIYERLGDHAQAESYQKKYDEYKGKFGQ
jgi:tetratricopeptide (TPR) repeat protein